MKRVLLIFIIVLLGLLVIGSFFYFLKGSKTQNEEELLEEGKEIQPTLSVEESPYVALTPSSDGHEFHLLVSDITSGVNELDYELVYKVASGITQGVPGTVKLAGKTSIERDLLLGTCSSGRCRYDEGVEEGTFTLRLRGSNGKLIQKFETKFHLQKGPKEITSADGKLSYSLTGTTPNVFYLTMGTFGLPAKATGSVSEVPYGIFTSGKTTLAGRVTFAGEGDLYEYVGSKWVKIEEGRATSLGIFARISP